MEIDDLKKKSRDIRKKIVKMISVSKTSHIGSALSLVDLLTVLYFKILNIDPNNPKSINRDKFILSKGHGCSALYATLALKGFFSEKILDGYCIDGGVLPGHSTLNAVPGIEATTGSLGHGLSMAVGMAFASKYDNHNSRVFVLMGDGECNEGVVWEAAMFASHHKLDNLIAVIDYNKLQGFGRTNEVMNLEPFKEKWISFGWAVKEINGHDFDQIINAFENIPFEKKKPSVIIAHTIKGKGISFMENQLAWHYKSPNEEQEKKSLEEIDLK